jgi:hypothetical protein
MNLIDRAAREMAAFQMGRDDWDQLGEAGQERFKVGVRMALNLLRDPDEQMKQAGVEIIRHVTRAESEAAYLNDAANTWRFMLDALLASGER